RSISFMIVGVLFRLFGAPIKAFIDKYLGLATAGFAIVVVGGFVAAAMLSGGSQETSAVCEAAAAAAAIR
ncbi:MAG TPA: DedA family protein, partial [Novosphingobium sp.]|nr:DedA family protein [Novosphingobium sp.]